MDPPSVTGGSGPISIEVTPNGRSAYALNSFGSGISQYDIDPMTGGLSPKTPATVDTGLFPRAMIVSPNGKSAYVTSDGFPEGGIQYTIDAVTGALKANSQIDTPSPLGTAISASGTSACVVNRASVPNPANTISEYDVDPLTGRLSPKTPSTVSAGSRPVWITISLDGQSAYVTNDSDNTVSQYDVDTATGALSPKSAAPVAAGGGPSGIAVGPRPASNR
jgi:6-phosphogluconolactonase